MTTEQKLREALDEIEAVLKGAHAIMETVSGLERRVGPVGSHARGYTHKITMALERLGRVRAALSHPEQQAPQAEPSEERAELVAALRNPRRWHELTDDQCERAAALLSAEPKPKAGAELTPGMAVQALAGEIVAALLTDEKDGGFDLTAGMFGAEFSKLVRRWAASEWTAHPPAAQNSLSVPVDVEFAAAYIDGVMKEEHPEIQGKWAKVRDFLNDIAGMEQR